MVISPESAIEQYPPCEKNDISASPPGCWASRGWWV